MARMPSLVVPGAPLHMVLRGEGREPIFPDQRLYADFLLDLGEAAALHGCAVHAYVLMPKELRLLLTPAEGDGPARMMRVLERRHSDCREPRAARCRASLGRRLWSMVLDPDRRFLACSRHIETNPLRARVVSEPDHYRWSSFRRNGLGVRDAVLTPHPLYLALGSTNAERQRAYRSLFRRRPAESLDPPGGPMR